MNRRARMLEALGVSTEWVLRGAEPVEAEAIEAALAEPVAAEVAVAAPEPVVAHIEAPLADAPSDGTLSRAQRIAAFDWAELEGAVSNCTSCKLCERRTHTVFGVGDRQAEWMLIGEAPGEQEDKQGEPFVGQAGKLLDSMLRSIGLSREKGVFIANVLKCRPPGNRDPEPDEVAMCDPYLKRQIALVKPRVIVVLGRIAAQTLLQTQTPVSKLRGKVHEVEGVPVVVTYHPAYLLRTLTDKARAWEDLCLARKVYAEHGGK
ncbi:uracil-DNA glycosylase [uncultured Ralstonia sp.]|jgi:uracil-DNA glycosylase family 4|uniref:uracil-DNA glycosylase n=1 Tax=Ralstonia sp. TaxID=54061 RepID=UPI001EA46DE4|nr:uracil-DNA glycosylase [uncultured Ralstonia sp.]UCF22137.1 MAG: uracil-DNA glycosylase [Ralstonia sp.]